MNFADKIAEKIKKERIKPLSPWYFSFKNWIFWISFFLSGLLGSIAFAMLLVALVQNEFSFHILMDMLWVPIVWVAIFCVFLYSSYYAVHHTKNGYKIPAWIWVGGNILISMIIGVVFYAVAMNHWDERMMEFSGMKKAQESFWSRPDEGFLSGKLEVENDAIVLIDFQGRVWNIVFDPRMQKKHPLLFMKLEKGGLKEKFLPPHPVKLKGLLQGENTFKVEDMRPFTRGPFREEDIRFQPVPSSGDHILPPPPR